MAHPHTMLALIAYQLCHATPLQARNRGYIAHIFTRIPHQPDPKCTSASLREVAVDEKLTPKFDMTGE